MTLVTMAMANTPASRGVIPSQRHHNVANGKNDQPGMQRLFPN
jgi:hypothetical protein